MNDYDFKSLSPWEFEQFSRDILHASLGLDFDIFKSGRDQGIDLRYSEEKNNNIIVQCKHYANSTFSNLKSDIKNKELEKIKKLSPSRYILVTSLGLSPKNKEEIAEILGDYLLSYSDIISRQNLNSILRDNPDIERNNISLWATTTHVLERILHSGIFNYSAAQKDSINDKLKYYVQNPSFDETKEILKKQHFCIIAGLPGIGKSTLAEMLLVDYMESGYEPIKVSSDISEAFDSLNPTKPRIYYYDDFLGQTGLEQKLNKNEDQRIVDFCQHCKKSNNTFFILTTREYILNQAKSTYEKLDKAGLDINKCVIDISSYSLFEKAKILYNHLYFLGVPEEYISNILKNNGYLKIIKHPSFNPRVIESMTANLSTSDILPEHYLNEIIYRLDNPYIIWEHAFKNQLTLPTKHLLIVILSLPSIVYLSDCKNLFDGFRKSFSSIYSNTRMHNEFNTALKECEGNFIKINLSSGKQTVEFQNPSVRDFLTYELSMDLELLILLVGACQNFDQLVSLWNTFESLEKNPFFIDSELINIYQEKLINTYGTKDLRLSRFYSINGGYILKYATSNDRDHCRFILSSGIPSVSNSLKVMINGELAKIFGNLDSIYDWSDIIPLMQAILDSQASFDLDSNIYLNKIIDFLPFNLNQVADYRALASLCEMFEIAHEKLSSKFTDFVCELNENIDEEISYINTVDDIGSLEECQYDLEYIMEVFGGDLSYKINEIKVLIDEISEEEEQVDDRIYRNTTREINHNDTEDIISLFDTLQ